MHISRFLDFWPMAGPCMPDNAAIGLHETAARPSTRPRMQKSGFRSNATRTLRANGIAMYLDSIWLPCLQLQEAKMGEENAFYFDEATGRWQERGKAPAPEPGPPPPPPVLAPAKPPGSTASAGGRLSL